MAVVVFVLFSEFGRGELRGITLVARAVVCLSGGALVHPHQEEKRMDPVCTADARDGTASVSGVLVEYAEWLERQRGLAPITIDNYCWNVGQFLTALPQPIEVSVSLLDAGTVTAFMVAYCRDRNTNSVKSMARSVRSFLRFAHATVERRSGCGVRFRCRRAGIWRRCRGRCRPQTLSAFWRSQGGGG